MKIFLSYPSPQRALAERLVLALEAEGHEVFFDRQDLEVGASFHQRLRDGIAAADALVFLVTPRSVAAGSYTLTELDIARQRWRRPSGRVLPVMVEPTPIADLPAYLSAVTILQPQGEPVAETVAAVARLRPPSPWPWRRMTAATLVLVLAGLGAWRHQVGLAEAAAQEAAARRDAAQAASARELCTAGSHAVALAQLSELARKPDAAARVMDLREDCAMQWLREIGGAVGPASISDQVAQAQPVLLQGLARAQGTRAADLRAHLGWGDYLRQRDGMAGLDPTVHWQRALVDDPENAYAHAMWGRHLLRREASLPEARSHFSRAVATGQHLGFVRNLQFIGTLGGSDSLHGYALTVADEMRRRDEKPSESQRRRLWSALFSTRLTNDAYRTTLLSALPGADLLKTFLWLYPPATVPEEQRLQWRFALSTLQAHAGDTAKARQGFEALVRELKASRSAGSLLDASERGLARQR